MTICVALFRGINVGGHNKLPMQSLRGILESLGCEQVCTYIQSGNAVFATRQTTGDLANALEAALDANFGFRPDVFILDFDTFKAIAAANPYSAAEESPSQVHVAFLADAPADPDLAKLEELKSPTESFALIGNAFFLHAPDGIGRSKLSAGVERALGVPVTGRNWRTVSKLLELADAIES